MDSLSLRIGMFSNIGNKFIHYVKVEKLTTYINFKKV